MSFERRKSGYRNIKVGNLKAKLRNMQTLHGKIKGSNYPKDTERIMEFGAGKLNDLLNWTDKNIKKVYAIEIDESSINEGNKKYQKYKNRRISQMHMKLNNKIKYKRLINNGRIKEIKDLPEIQYIQGDLTSEKDVKEIMKTLSGVKMSIDHIVSNFSIHYFMRNEKTVNNLLRLINYFLKIGGSFRFTCLDGRILYNNFNILCNSRIDKNPDNTKNVMDNIDIIKKNAEKVSKKSRAVVLHTNKKNTIEFKEGKFTYFRLKRLYGCNNKFMNHGQKISVYIISIGKSHNEYLVNLDYLTKKFDKHGYRLDDYKGFSEYIMKYINKKKEVKKLTQSEYKYSIMNMYVSFIRELSSVIE
jgi:hypothetical protein